MPPDDLESVLAVTRELAEQVVAGEAEACDRDAVWPEQSIRAAQQAGIAGLVIPKEYGGLGHGLAAIVRVCEIMGRESGSAAICLGMHYVASAVIAAKATDHQVDTYLKPICEGRHITTLALSEPGTGAHFYYPETTLKRTDAGDYRVNGVKSFATNGGKADSYVVSTTAAEDDAPPGLFSCVVVPGQAEGLSWHQSFRGFGMRGNESRGFDLGDVKVPAADLLGEEGDQIWYVFNVVAPYFLVSMAGTYLGIASRAMEEAIAHLRSRSYNHTGSSLDQNVVLQNKLGALWPVLERTRQLIYYAAGEADRGGPNALPALCSAKAEVGDCVVKVTNEAMTLIGGRGYGDNGLMARLLRDARAAHVMAPTTDILHTWAGRALLDIPLLGE